MAMINRSQGQTDTAVQLFTQVVTQFADSEYADRARSQLAELAPQSEAAGARGSRWEIKIHREQSRRRRIRVTAALREPVLRGPAQRVRIQVKPSRLQMRRRLRPVKAALRKKAAQPENKRQRAQSSNMIEDTTEDK